MFYFADPRYAVWGATLALQEDSLGPELVDASDYAPPYGVITSQSCDLAEDGFEIPRRPWFQVAPVYDLAPVLSAGDRKQLRRQGGALYQFHLPGLSGGDHQFWVADFRIEIPVEKSWLAGKEPILGLPTDLDRRTFAARLGWMRNRPAWAEVVIDAVQRVLVNELAQTKKDNRPLFDEVVATVIEVGARTDSMTKPSRFQLLALCEYTPTQDVQDWWSSVNSKIRQGLYEHDVACQQESILTASDCSVSLYRQFSPVPLLKYSPM